MPSFELLSDIHSNLWKPNQIDFSSLFPAKTSTLILAGNIGNPDHPSLHSLIRYVCNKYSSIIYVPGNHEFIGKPPHKVLHWFERVDEEFSNFHFFYRRTERINGIRVIGATAWTSGPYGTSYSNMVNQEGKKDRDYIDKMILSSNDATLVVSHYCPTLRVLKDAYSGTLAQYDYAQNLEYMFRPPLHTWVFGHIHQTYEFKLPYTSSMFGDGSVNLLCMPYGKPSDGNITIPHACRFEINPDVATSVKFLPGKTYRNL
jgi:predicted phosphodiesterase